MRHPNRDTWICAALLVLVTVMVYLPSMRAGFIWDDDALVTNNPAVKTADGLYSIWFTSWSGDYVPLTTFGFWLEWHLWKANPAGYHIVNILLHAANVALLWRVLAGLRVTCSWLAALLFAVHPVCAASVTWVAEGKNTLSMLFYLASLLYFLRDDQCCHTTAHVDGATSAGGGPSRWFWYSLGAFALALLAKSSVVILPPVLLLCVWWRRGRITRQDFARTIPFFALSFLFSAVAIYIQHKALHTGAGPSQDPLITRLIGGGWALWFYFWKILLPVNLTMIYQRWVINPGAALSYAPAMLFAAMMALFWWNRGRWGGPFLFAFGYFVIALSPVLGFFDMAFFSNSQVADHFQYLAMPGILALIAAGILKLSGLAHKCADGNSEVGNRPPGAGRALGPVLVAAFMAGAVVVSLSTATWRRQALLGNSQRLWEDNLAKNATSWRVYMNLNLALLEQGKTNEAIRMNNKASELFPGRNK